MPSNNPYNVPLPITVLWDAIAGRYGDAAVVELQALYSHAQRRYDRAEELRHIQYLLARGPHSAERRRQYEQSLADPQAFIDRE